MLSTAAGYLTLLYLSYTFPFIERGAELPSYVRYANSVTLPMILLALAPLLPGFRSVVKEREPRPESRGTHLRAALFAVALAALWIFETPYLRPLVTANPSVELRRELEPTAAAIRQEAQGGRSGIYLPQDQPNGFIGRLEYLLAPTAASVQRSATFFEQERSAITGEWQKFKYVWIPVAPSPELVARLAPFIAGDRMHGLFRLVGGGGR